MPLPEMNEKARQAYDEALRRIERCRRQGRQGTELDLGGLGLTTLPPEIGQLTALTWLYLSDNQLTTLPPEIGQLTALRDLNLRSNQLTTLPPEIGQLTALTRLDLSNNQLTTLPPEIGQLQALSWLDLSRNQLTTLPSEFGHLPALTGLHLSGNQLTTVPPEFGRFEALTMLWFDRNQVTTLPPEFGRLRSLEQLFLHDNQLTALPPEFGQLQALTELYLHGNPHLGLSLEVLGPTWDNVHGQMKAQPADPKTILDFYFERQGQRSRPTESPTDSTPKQQPPAPTEEVKATAPAETLHGRTRVDGDACSDEDHLGRKAHAMALARFISHPQTGTPLTVSVEGLWGCGKTSFMRQVEKHLAADGQRPLTIWFNPWRHTDASALWAAFALELARQLREQCGFCRRWVRGPLLLWLDRPPEKHDVSGWVRFSVRLVFFLGVLVASVVGLCGLAMAAWSWRNDGGASLAKLWTSAKDTFKEGSVLSNGWTMLKALAGIEVLRQAWKLRETPLAGKIAKLLRAEAGSGGQPSDMERFHEEYARMVRAFAEDKRLYVFVDDLDRCDVPKAAELLQAINLMLSGDGMKAVFILGLDREKVAAGIAVKHKELLPYLYSRERRAEVKEAAASNPANAPKLEEALHNRDLEFGYEFIEKFIQLPFRLPTADDEGMQKFLCEITGVKPEEIGKKKRARRILEARLKHSMPEAPAGSPVADATEEMKAESDRSWQELESHDPVTPVIQAKKLMEQTRIDILALNLAENIATDEALYEAMEMILPFIGRNPRRIKQALNLLRLWSYLSAKWLRSDDPRLSLDLRSGEPFLTIKKLAKVVAMELSWPVKLLDLMDQAARPEVAVNVSIEHLTDDLPKSLIQADSYIHHIRVCDLRAILSVAPPASRRDSVMEEQVLASGALK